MASKDEKPEVEDKDALDLLDAEAKEFDKDAEIDRILKAFRLDAYAVLDLQPGVPESDIKMTYRKKSLLIHPDKTRNPQAPDAFDRLKKAQTELMDEKHRERLDEAIADARMLLIRENGWTVDSPELKTDAFARRWRDKAREVLVDNELRRKRQARAQMQEEGREQRRADAELEERKRKRQHEQDWETTRDQRIDSWRQFKKGKGSSASASATAGAGNGAAAGGDNGKKKKKKLKPIG
ncbi:DnaJ domain-containing protein [Xylariomycetidae sp. FL2044]|nr:DnaJ domain-containing protein [Xylariomycetidae sp. FL2044]